MGALKTKIQIPVVSTETIPADTLSKSDAENLLRNAIKAQNAAIASLRAVLATHEAKDNPPRIPPEAHRWPQPADFEGRVSRARFFASEYTLAEVFDPYRDTELQDTLKDGAMPQVNGRIRPVLESVAKSLFIPRCWARMHAKDRQAALDSAQKLQDMFKRLKDAQDDAGVNTYKEDQPGRLLAWSPRRLRASDAPDIPFADISRRLNETARLVHRHAEALFVETANKTKLDGLTHHISRLDLIISVLEQIKTIEADAEAEAVASEQQ